MDRVHTSGGTPFILDNAGMIAGGGGGGGGKNDQCTYIRIHTIMDV